MRKIFLLLSICTLNLNIIHSVWGQNVTILPSGITPNNAGSYPRLTYDQILALPSPQKGDLAMDLTFNHLRFYNGTKWVSLLTTEDISIPLTMAWKAGGTEYDEGKKIILDANGNIYITGYFYGTATFGTSTLTSVGSSDIFIAKYSSNGDLIWIVKAGGVNQDVGVSLALDTNNNLFILGTFQGTANFESSNIISAGSNDVFLAKYNNNGNLQWVKRAGSDGFEQSYDVKTNGNGDVFITGGFWFNATFETTSITSAGDSDIFLAKYSNDGDLAWVKQAGGTGSDIGYAIVLDGNSTVYVTGVFHSTASFGSATVTTDTNGIFIAKFRISDWQWATSATSSSYNVTVGYGIVLDINRNIYITGSFWDTINLGTRSYTSTGGGDLFLVKFNSNGVFQWFQQAGSAEHDLSQNISIDNVGNIYITGYSQGATKLGNISLDAGNGAFLAKFNPIMNTWEWAKKAKGMLTTNSISMAVKGNNDIYTIGNFDYYISFGNFILNSSGYFDIYWVRWVF
jgi:Beta-propeller repeat